MKEGRIIFYNAQAGNGKIILASREKYDFSIDVWDDYNTLPEAGQLVECEIKKGVIQGIVVIPQNQSPIDKNDTRIADALEAYYKPVESAIGQPPDIVKTKEQIDYFLSKRFLLTAYNNLKSFDSSLHDHTLVISKIGEIRKLEKAYHTSIDKLDVPQIAFESIFLRIQPEYQQYLKDKGRCNFRISILTTQLNEVLPEIESREFELQQLDKSEKEKRKQIEHELKVLRGASSDAAHERATLREELNDMQDVKAIFTEKYFKDFITELGKSGEVYKKIIKKILDYKAFELDEIIWRNASKSKLIREYFTESGIKGTYSTTTYLDYYLKNLDNKKLGEEATELSKLLVYLKSR